MPLIKTYLIVTNNALELSVMVDIRGVKGAADYLGITVQAARNRIHKNSWGKLPYKILVDELAEVKVLDKGRDIYEELRRAWEIEKITEENQEEIDKFNSYFERGDSRGLMEV